MFSVSLATRHACHLPWARLLAPVLALYIVASLPVGAWADEAAPAIGDVTPALHAPSAPSPFEQPDAATPSFLGSEGLALMQTALGRLAGDVVHESEKSSQQGPRILLDRAGLLAGMSHFAREIKTLLRPDSSREGTHEGAPVADVSTADLTETIAGARRDAGEARRLAAEVRQRAEELSQRFAGIGSTEDVVEAVRPAPAVATPSPPSAEDSAKAVAASETTRQTANAGQAKAAAPDALPGMMSLGQAALLPAVAATTDDARSGSGEGIEVITPSGAVVPADTGNDGSQPPTSVAAIPRDDLSGAGDSGEAAQGAADAATPLPVEKPEATKGEASQPIPVTLTPVRRLTAPRAATEPASSPATADEANGRAAAPAKRSQQRRVSGERPTAAAGNNSKKRSAKATQSGSATRKASATGGASATTSQAKQKSSTTNFEIPSEIRPMGWN